MGALAPRLHRRGVLAGGLAAGASACTPSRGTRADARPNVVWIITDDMSARELAHLPRVRRSLVRGGATFGQGYAAVPWCGPARVSMLTGLYPHNHGCTTNQTLPDFRATGLDQDTVGTRLQAAGYATGYFGKFMNWHGEDPHYVAPGWDRFVALFGRARGVVPIAYDGTVEHVPTRYGSGDQVVARDLRTFVAENARRPFFVVFAPTNPHAPYLASRAHRHAYDDVGWDPPALNEADLSDKPSWMRDLPVLDPAALRTIWERKLEELQDTDDQIDRILATLTAHRVRRRTVVVLVSDNGYLLGEHRLFGKSHPYEEATRLPFVVRGPGVRPGRMPALVSQVDLMPTTLAVAGLDPYAGRPVDGRDLLPSLRTGDWSGWRTRLLVENPDAGWASLREGDDVFVDHHVLGERELYDLATDPHQLHSRVGPRADAYAEVLLRLRTASGAELRSLEA